MNIGKFSAKASGFDQSLVVAGADFVWCGIFYQNVGRFDAQNGAADFGSYGAL